MVTNVTTNWSGVLNADDFNTHEPYTKRINNQVKAENLEHEFKGKKEKRDKKKEYLSMSLEQLKELSVISNSNGRPNSSMTDEKWQLEFELRKNFIQKYDSTITRVGGKYSRIPLKWNEETMGEYDGITNWQSYCWYMNDILSVIRSGNRDYCYYLYQVMHLAHFDFGDKELKTKYYDGYWEVWLSDKKMD